MNEEHRKRVLNWIAEQPNSDVLEIYDVYSGTKVSEIPNVDSMSLEDLVMKIIQLTGTWATKEVGKIVPQCRAGASRSIFDIWRICRFYRPETDIFELFPLLYRLVEEKKLKTWRCCTIHRRVYSASPFQSTEIYSQDEFELYFNISYKDI